MKAVLLGLKTLCNNTTGKHIWVQSDNTTTLSYINEMGEIKSVLCNDMAQTIWVWCIDSNIWLSASHIPGSQNTDADKQSRVFNVSTEWSLCTYLPQDLSSKSLVMSLGDQTPMPCLFVCHVWHNYSFYAFPPFSLRANAQKNRANRGHSSKPNLPSF